LRIVIVAEPCDICNDYGLRSAAVVKYAHDALTRMRRELA
jgi:hypothetical protein